DCILIIMAALDDRTAQDLEEAAQAFGMDVLLEVHDEQELERALRLRSRLIGINNRNLKTFETTLATSRRLAPKLPPGHIIVGESGIFLRPPISPIWRPWASRPSSSAKVSCANATSRLRRVRSFARSAMSAPRSERWRARPS